MVSRAELFDNVWDYAGDHNLDMDPDNLAESINGLSPLDRQELDDLVSDDANYDDFADWCYEHDMEYH